MKPESKRARRRHDRWRMVRKAERVVKLWWSNYAPATPHPQKLADNLRICSCWCCSSHKRWMAGAPVCELRRREET